MIAIWREILLGDDITRDGDVHFDQPSSARKAAKLSLIHGRVHIKVVF